MSFEVIFTEPFEKKAKRLIKKYPSFRKELNNLTDSLAQNPELGVALGNNCFKIRVAIKSKGKGKSGGARVITFLRTITQKIYLIDVYDKSEQSTISDKELKLLVELFTS
ncbi:MAG: type II toxin-antitoxin system RelE/ParE family toxin [Bacteroidetes bacterium]|nr:type II toxin-antitoxin system RelE/ParE family toxin [Bacteroidota bacterium]